ncbi:MAG TPA: radical SAM protein [Anaerolineae bacterium]|nr:radical SAM protein [Anaerolineae bacterium]
MRVLFVAQQIDYEPQGIMSLSSALKEAGHQVELAVAAHHDPLEAARAFRPDLVAYSVITGSQRFYLDLNRRLKAEWPHLFSVFGGPHPTFFPEMVGEEGVDGICRGEGEEALVELVDTLAAGGPEAVLGVANWSFLRNGDTIVNPVRPYVHDLDSLPFPDRALVYERDPVTARSKIKHFLAGRGCPYNCTYCFNHALGELYRGKGKRFRLRSVDHVIEEVRWVRDHYPLEFVVFVDDTFVLSRDWLAEFAEKFPREIGLPFFCNTRANLVTEEQVRMLKAAGCHSVSMGIEAGSDRVRNGLLKRRMSKEQILEAARLLREGGLHFTTTNMIGLPTTTLADDFETLDLNIQIRPSYAHVFIFQPYPRTELGEFTREHGWMVGTFDDIGEVAWDHSVLDFDEAHKRGLAVLQRFFAIGVEWPRTVPLIKRLMKLPDNFFFVLLNKLWKGWAIKNRIHPVRLSLREMIETAWHFMRIKS